MRTMINFKLTESDLELLDAVAQAITPPGVGRLNRADAHRYAVRLAAEKLGVFPAEAGAKKVSRKVPK